VRRAALGKTKKTGMMGDELVDGGNAVIVWEFQGAIHGPL
jgi:hypothetical protein